MTTAHIASLPEREETLIQTVCSLLPQVDHVFVSLNNYKKTPAFLRDEKKVTTSLCDNSLGDAAKFLNVDFLQGYIFVCDDDLIYPDNYVEYMVDKINALNGAVSLLGKVYSDRPIKSFRTGYTSIYRCLSDVGGDHQVDVCGTGALAYRASDLDVPIDAFYHRNMADVWFSKLAHEQKVPIFVVEHPKDFVSHVMYEQRIWNERVDDTIQTAVLNSFLT